MTNDGMTNDEGMTKPETRMTMNAGTFVIWHSGFLRHWSFRHSSFASACFPHRLRRAQFRLVADEVAVALFRQEHLPVVGEVQFARVARHQRVEVGDLTVGLWPQDAPQPLRLL